MSWVLMAALRFFASWGFVVTAAYLWRWGHTLLPALLALHAVHLSVDAAQLGFWESKKGPRR